MLFSLFSFHKKSCVKPECWRTLLKSAEDDETEMLKSWKTQNTKQKGADKQQNIS